MPDVSIERLRVRFENAAGHEHRVHGIVSRAAALFGEFAANRLQANAAMGILNAGPVAADFASSSDEQIAGLIADAWSDAVPGLRERQRQWQR